MKTYSQGQLQALIMLLGDDDARTASVARNALRDAGESAVPFLQQASASADPQLRGRSRLLLEEVRTELLARRIAEYAEQDDSDMDLLEGALLVAEYAHPDLNGDEVRRFVEEAAEAVVSRLGSSFSDMDGLRALGTVLFDQYGLRGGSFSDPDESYINRVISRRTGLPISLAVVYTLVGRRAGLPVSGVNLPFFFLARYETECGPVFVDCYNRGRLLDRDDCEAIVTGGGGRFAEVQLRAEVPRYVLARMLSNLDRVYRGLKDENKAQTAVRFRNVLLREM